MTDEVRNSADNGEFSQKDIADAEALLGEKGSETTETVVQEEKKESKPEETPTPEPKKEAHEEVEDLDHGEKSKEGRQAKKLRRELAEFKAEARAREERLLSKIESLVGKKTVAEDDPEPELSEVPSADEIRAHSQWTMRQVEKKSASKETLQNESLTKYKDEYKQMVHDFVDAEEESDLFALLTNTTDLTFNVKLSDDPKKDFMTNFKNAQSYLEGKKPKKAVHTKVPLGTNTGSSTAKIEAPEVDLSGLSFYEQQAAKLFSPEELKQMKADGRL